MAKTVRLDTILAVFLVVALSVVYWMTARPGHDWGGDFAQYIVHARNLAGHRPYRETQYVVEFPESIDHMPAVYPPVFPLLLAPVYARYGLNYPRLKTVNGAMFVLTALLTFLIGRQLGFSSWRAAAAALAFGLCGEALIVKDMVLSDGAYAFFAGLTLAAAIFVEQRALDRRRPVIAAALVAAPMILAYGARASGLSLPLAFAAWQLLVKRRITWFNTLVLAAFGAGLVFYSRTVFDGRSYSGVFRFEPRFYLENVDFYLRACYALWVGSPRIFVYAMMAITLPLALYGWLRRAAHPSILEIYMPAALAPALLLTSYGSARYLLPLFAFYFLYTLDGFSAIARLRFASYARPLSFAFYSLLALGAVLNLRGLDKGPHPEGVEQPTFTAVCNYIDHHVGANALIVSWNPRVLALYTDRPSAWYPRDDSAAERDRYLQSVGDYVLVYNGDPEKDRLLTILARHPDEFTSDYANADFTLYRRERRAGAESAQ